MLICSYSGRVATYRDKEKGRYLVQFSLPGGKTYTYRYLVSRQTAEFIACSTAMSHPTWKDMELSSDWKPRFPFAAPENKKAAST